MALTTTPSELTATALTLTTAAQPNITSVGTLTTLTVDDITINGSTISDAADFTIDVAGDITLDAGGGDINFKDDGTLWGAISNVSSDVVMQSSIQDKDIIFKGNDGGSIVTALILDMSDAGKATFNAGATFGGSVGIGSGSGTTASAGYDELVIQGGNADIGMAFLSPAANNKTQTISFGDSNNNSSGKITYNHSTDAMAFNTAGTERMRIDSGGNVGINSSATRVYTASFGSSDNVKHLTVKSASGSVLELVGSSNSHQVGMGAIQFVNDANDNNTANAGGKELALIMVQTETSDTNTSSDSGGVLRIFTKPEAGTTAERMRIDSAGKVGIGGASAGDHLHVQDSSSSCNVRISGEGNINRKVQIGYDASVGPYIQAGSSGIATLRVYVDNTSYVSKFDSNGDFYSNDGTVHNLSDVRVKKDIAHLTDGLEIVKQLKPRTYKYTEDSEMYNEKSKDEVRYGFIANEVEEVAPQYTKTGKGKVGDEEVEDFKSLSATKMIPMLVKALQEALTRIEALEAK